jgi:hypothetical protein
MLSIYYEGLAVGQDQEVWECPDTGEDKEQDSTVCLPKEAKGRSKMECEGK